MTGTTLERYGRETGITGLLALLKPRVMSLAVFTAAAGLLAAPVAVQPLVAASALAFIALGAGACGSLNMWWDADIDARMQRTKNRPIPSGAIDRGTALGLGVGLSSVAVIMLGLTVNILSAVLLAATIVHYVCVYTMLLKRTTPQNIVIGGIAGALPPVIGWSAATGSVSIEAGLMFMIIFLWTPPHSWALALFTGRDYENAGVPMLTVTHGPIVVQRMILIYALALIPVSLLLAFSSIGGPVFFVSSVILNFLFTKSAVGLAKAGHGAERQLFALSLVYMFVIFSAIIVDAGLREVVDRDYWPVWI